MSGSLELRMESGEREQLASPQNEPTASEVLGKFQRLKPTILGAIEVTIGISMALTAITYLAVGVGPYLTAILFWGILIYIPAGGLTIAADRKPTRDKVCAALGMNVLVALSAIAGSLLHGYGVVIFGFLQCVSLKGCSGSSRKAALGSSRKAALCSSRKPSKEHTVI
ncbi:unnamed protein product [Arctogadus glacialis]